MNPKHSDLFKLLVPRTALYVAHDKLRRYPLYIRGGRVLESLIRMFALTLLIQRPLFIFELHRRKRKLDYEQNPERDGRV